MKQLISLIAICLFLTLPSCEKKVANAVALSVDFTWEGYANCSMGLPQMSIGGIPENTKFLTISM